MKCFRMDSLLKKPFTRMSWAWGIPPLIFFLMGLTWLIGRALPAEVAPGYIYLLPVWLSFFVKQRSIVLLTPVLCTFLILSGLWQYEPDRDRQTDSMVMMNYSINLIVLWLTAAMTYLLRKMWNRAYVSRRQEDVLIELGRQAASGEDFHKLMDWTHATLAGHFQSKYSKVLRYLPEEESAVLISGCGWDKEINEKWSESARLQDNTFASYTLHHRGSVVVKDLSAETRFRIPNLLMKHHIRSCINVLIPGKPHPYGILELDTPKKAHFSEADINFLESIARLLADAIERLNLNSQLKKRNEELNAFVMVASHDLKEPAANTRLLLETLFATKPDIRENEELRYYLDSIYSSSAQMLDLIEGLLRYARADKIEMAMDLLPLDRVLQNVIKGLEPRIRESGAAIELEKLPDVFGDEMQLQQVFGNLISNSIKYAKKEEPPRIRICGRETGRTVEIRIEDNGLGIEKKNLEKIFTPFYREKPVAEKGSTGLGLSICKKIIEKHCGDIQVESEPGRGTAFILSLKSKHAVDVMAC